MSIILMNLLIALITIPTFLTSNYWIIITQRFFLGFLSAVIVNASSLVISETFPTEIQTTFGIVINLGIVVGILVNQLFGLALP